MGNVFAQMQTGEDVMADIVDSTLLNVLKENGILKDIRLRDIDYLLDFENISDQLTKKARSGLLPKVHTNIMMDNSYYKGDSSFQYPADVVYSSLRLGTKVASFGVPLDLRGTVTAVNGRINKNFSTFSFAFDTKSALKNLGKEIIPSVGAGESILSKLRHGVNMNGLEEKLLLDELKTAAYQKIITNPKYLNLRDSVFLLKKELLTEKDTLLRGVDTTYLKEIDSLQSLLDGFEKLESSYFDLWGTRDNRLQQLSGLKERLLKYKENITNYMNPTKLKDYLLESGKADKLTFKEKLGVYVKNAGIGLVSINDREFTYRNLSLLGGLVEFEGKRFFSSVGYGKHNLSQNLSFFSDQFFAKGYEGNKFLYAKVGIGKPKSDFVQVSYLKSARRDVNSNLGFLTPRNNAVIAIAMKQVISKKSSIITDFAASKQDILPVDVQGIGVKSGQENLAFSLKTELLLIKDRVKFDLGYFQVGPAFYSAGNPFLLTNRKGIKGAISTTFWKQRIFVKGHMDFAVSKVSKRINTVPLQRFDFAVESKVRLLRNHDIFLRYAPTNNYRGLAQSRSRSQNYMYIAQANSRFNLTDGTKLLSNISLTNLQTSFDNIDTSFTLENSYAMVRETVAFGSTSIIGTGMVASQDFFKNEISDYRVQLEYNQTYKKVSYRLGGLLELRRWDNENKIGLVSGISCRFLKNYSVNIQSTIRRARVGHQKKVDLVGQLSLLGKF